MNFFYFFCYFSQWKSNRKKLAGKEKVLYLCSQETASEATALPPGVLSGVAMVIADAIFRDLGLLLSKDVTTQFFFVITIFPLPSLTFFLTTTRNPSKSNVNLSQRTLIFTPLSITFSMIV